MEVVLAAPAPHPAPGWPKPSDTKQLPHFTNGEVVHWRRALQSASRLHAPRGRGKEVGRPGPEEPRGQAEMAMSPAAVPTAAGQRDGAEDSPLA